MRVPFFDATRSARALEVDLHSALQRVLNSGSYILGFEVEAFEAELAASLGVSYAVALSSGTDALLVALQALGVGPGHEVVCPAYTFVATAEVIVRLGATPVFVDVDPETYLSTPALMEAALSSRSRALLPVHLFGRACDLEGLRAVAQGAGVALVEDTAQAQGAASGPRRAGTVGDFGSLSFFPTKVLGALGDGGALLTSDPELAARARSLRSHGLEEPFGHVRLGGNFRMDALQAAFLRAKLPRLEQALAQRRRRVDLYDQELADLPGIVPPAGPRDGSVWSQYVVRVPGEGRRDELRQRLAARGVETRVYYPAPLHLQPCFALFARGPLPVAETLSRETLALPLYPELEEAELDWVVGCVRAWVSGRLGPT